MKNYELLFLVQDILLTIQPNNNGLTAKEISTVTNTPIEHINIAIGRLSLDDKMIITHEGTNGSPTKYTLDSRGRNAITSQHYKIKAETEEMIYNSFEAQKLAADVSVRLGENQITFNTETKNFNSDIKGYTSTTKNLVLIQTVAFVVQLFFISNTYNTGIENQESHKLELIRQQQEIDSFHMELSRFLNTTYLNTDTVHISNYPNSLSGRNKPKPKD